MPTGSTPPTARPGHSAMPGTGVPAPPAAAFLPAPLSPQGRHQPKGGTRQPRPHPPFTPRPRGSGSPHRLSPRQAQPGGGSCAGGRRQSWTPSRVGTAPKRRSAPPWASATITPERHHEDMGMGGGWGVSDTGTAGPWPPLAPVPSRLCLAWNSPKVLWCLSQGPLILSRGERGQQPGFSPWDGPGGGRETPRAVQPQRPGGPARLAHRGHAMPGHPPSLAGKGHAAASCPENSCSPKAEAGGKPIPGPHRDTQQMPQRRARKSSRALA